MRWIVWAPIGITVAMASCHGEQTPDEQSPDAGLVRGPDSGERWDSDPIGPDSEDPCPLACSEDLHAVVECSGDIHETCPPDKGCLAGACVAPCEAADGANSTTGCEYAVPAPAQIPGREGQCFAVAVANTWTTDATLAVEYLGATLNIGSLARLAVTVGSDVSYEPLPGGKLPAGKVALLFLASRGDQAGSACPGETLPAITDRYVEGPDTALLSTFRITSDRPVNAFAFYPYGAGTVGMGTASLLYPTSAWTTTYLAQTPYPTGGEDGTRFVQIVAKDDETQIEIQPAHDLVGAPDAGIPACKAGDRIRYALDKGQTLQLVQNEELTGSVVIASKPIGIWGGATRLAVDSNLAPDDITQRQVAPVALIGDEYAAVRYGDRVPATNENTPWRIVGVVDGTALFYSPKRPKNAPSVINQGEVATFWFEAGEDEPPFPFVVRSQDDQHPFYFWSYMTNGANANGLGGAEWTDVVPMKQYRRSYLFFTDPTFPETNLVVVRQRERGEFGDVTVDCAGPLHAWTPVDPEDEFEFARLDLSSSAGCASGRHLVLSDRPFALTVWGWGSGSSYSFPAGNAGHFTRDPRGIPGLK